MKIFRLFVAFTLVCFALIQNTQAVSPPPPGGYPNFTTATGDHALQALTLGLGNTAIGKFSLFSVTTGNYNTAVGAGALDLNLGDLNTATGAAALLFNTTGTQNTAAGTAALELNDTGQSNTANGAFALFSNTTGMLNTANGVGALQSNTIGNDNTANGVNALLSNTTGGGNTADGRSALANNTSGGGNIALGAGAGGNLTTGNNNIDIGSGGVAGESNTIRIGNPALQATVFITGISGTPVTGTAVVVNGSNQLGVAPSSERFKTEIRPMDKTSEAILALKPVTFRYKKEVDPNGIQQFGLVAEEVEKVNRDLVVRNAKGKVYTVRYEAVNAMLLNEFLKEHKAFVEQQRKLEQQDVSIAKQQKQIEALTTGLQKVERTD